METRRIGSLQVTALGLGCTNFGKRTDEATSAAIVRAALDEGIRFFDTADTYGWTRGEEYLGRALRGVRQDVLVATKFGQTIDAERGGARPEYVLRAVEDSLRRLGTDYIDLYQLHLPDPTVPLAETMGALQELVRAGTVREIGCSNFSAAELLEAEAAARVAGRADEAAAPGAATARFVSVQNEYSLLAREPEREVFPACQRLGLAFIPYFPLAAGLLTGKFRRGQPAPAGTRAGTGTATERRTPEALDAVEALIAFAEARGHTLLELALSWLLRPGIPLASVIAGAMTPEQLRANVAAARWRLDAEELAEVDRLVPPPEGP
ncbi:MAG TPA: aldo/keto reductase [Longimicrobiales bacterium]